VAKLRSRRAGTEPVDDGNEMCKCVQRRRISLNCPYPKVVGLRTMAYSVKLPPADNARRASAGHLHFHDNRLLLSN